MFTFEIVEPAGGRVLHTHSSAGCGLETSKIGAGIKSKKEGGDIRNENICSEMLTTFSELVDDRENWIR